MTLRSLLKTLVNETIGRPPYVKYCSQTLHQTLFAATLLKEEKVEKASFDRLCDKQLPSGGFDIGYEFDFGFLHKKGMPVTPELLSMCALARASGSEEKKQKASDGVRNWITSNLVRGEQGGAYLPYCPAASTRLVVCNALSFAIAGGAALSSVDEATIESLVHRLHWEYEQSGRTANYYASDYIKTARYPEKLDFYHLAQQIFCHKFALQYVKLPALEAITDLMVAELLTELTNNGLRSIVSGMPVDSGKIRTWALASIVQALCRLSHTDFDRFGVKTPVLITDMADLLLRSVRGGKCSAVIDLSGGAVDQRYFVRTAAWVAHGLALAGYNESVKAADKQRYLQAASGLVSEIAKNDFSGPENHAFPLRMRLLQRVVLAGKGI